MMQDAIRRLLAVAPLLTDELEEERLVAATELHAHLVRPLSEDDVRALLSILPPSGDTAHGLNWTGLHAVEAAPSWPIWAALTDAGNEWTALFLARLRNGGVSEPQP